jgi:hypothetical protein
MEKGNQTFLWGCKCRSGKTFMIGGIILERANVRKTMNVLIITPVPTETMPQFTDDLFNRYRDFDNFKIYCNKSYIENKINIDDDNNVIIISKQLLQSHMNDKKTEKMKIDIIFFDENHYCGTTDISKQILKACTSKHTTKIYLTATYNKPIKEWNIPSDCQMFWDIEDEQICKKLANDDNCIDLLIDKHEKDHIADAINYFMQNDYSMSEIFAPYLKMPDLHMITNMFDIERYETLANTLKMHTENKMGFCFDTLLSLNSSKTRFKYQHEVQLFLRYVSGSYKEMDGNKTIFTRIHDLIIIVSDVFSE